MESQDDASELAAVRRLLAAEIEKGKRCHEIHTHQAAALCDIAATTNDERIKAIAKAAATWHPSRGGADTLKGEKVRA